MSDRSTADPVRAPEPPTARRRVGRAMTAAAVVGVLVAALGVVVGWRLVGGVEDTTTESLDVTLEALDSIDDTIELSERLLFAVGETLATTEATLEAVDESFGAGSAVLLEVAELTDTVGPSLADVARILRQLEDAGSTIDALLGDLSQIPFGPDYDPDRPLGTTIGTLAETVDGLPAQFAAASAELDGFDRSVVDISAQLDRLRAAVAEVRSGLDASTALIDRYRANVDDAREIARSASNDVGTDVGVLRAVLVIGGVAIAFGQIAPFWLGRQLTRRPDDVDRLLGRD